MFVQLFQNLVGGFLIVPEHRIRGYFFKVINFFFPFIDVKDTPVTVRGDDESPAVFLFVVQTWFLLLFF